MSNALVIFVKHFQKVNIETSNDENIEKIKLDVFKAALNFVVRVQVAQPLTLPFLSQCSSALTL